LAGTYLCGSSRKGAAEYSFKDEFAKTNFELKRVFHLHVLPLHLFISCSPAAIQVDAAEVAQSIQVMWQNMHVHVV